MGEGSVIRWVIRLTPSPAMALRAEMARLLVIVSLHVLPHLNPCRYVEGESSLTGSQASEAFISDFDKSG